MNTVFKVILVLLAVVILTRAFFLVLGLMTMALWAACFLALGGGAVYLLYQWYCRQKPPAMVHRLWDPDGRVLLYQEQPELSQLFSRQADSRAECIALTNETQVLLLQMSDHAAKVKVLNGTFRGKTGWIDRSQIVGLLQPD